MARRLIITNGDSAAELLKAARIGDEVLPWRDCLHVGPVPQTDELTKLSVIRAKYLVSVGLGEPEKCQQDFLKRDTLLARNEDYDNVTLWFEHDLYDQLQLLQTLAWFADHWRDDGRVFLVQADDYLGMQTPETIGSFGGKREPVTGLQLSMAKIAWAAFSHETPEAWVKLLNEDLTALPFLKPAVLRMLEELPSTGCGLSRVEHQIIKLIDAGVHEPRFLFGEYLKSEDAIFLGDSIFFMLLAGLSNAASPLLTGNEGARWKWDGSWSDDDRKSRLHMPLRLTAFGKDVLANRADHATTNKIDHWWGGTPLTNDNLWRWDRPANELLSPELS